MSKYRRYVYADGMVMDKMTGRRYCVRMVTDFNVMVDGMPAGVIPISMVEMLDAM